MLISAGLPCPEVLCHPPVRAKIPSAVFAKEMAPVGSQVVCWALTRWQFLRRITRKFNLAGVRMPVWLNSENLSPGPTFNSLSIFAIEDMISHLPTPAFMPAMPNQHDELSSAWIISQNRLCNWLMVIVFHYSYIKVMNKSSLLNLFWSGKQRRIGKIINTYVMA